jgi:hypothetical protein
VSLWRDKTVLWGSGFALGTLTLIGIMILMRHPSVPQNLPAGIAEREHAPISAAHGTNSAAMPPHTNSLEILARCQPELKETPSVPTFEIGENFNRVAVQMKVRFVVDKEGFVMNAYVIGATVVTPADQEGGLDYVRHLTFAAPAAEECQTIKMQMVGTFHMSKDSSGDWITVFDAHPVYSFNGTEVVVNQN